MLLKKNFIICDELQCTSVCSKMFARLFVNSTCLIISAKSEKISTEIMILLKRSLTTPGKTFSESS